MNTPYIVVPNKMDAVRPFQVIATFRKFNRVMGTFETKQAARRSCTRRNRLTTIKV